MSASQCLARLAWLAARRCSERVLAFWLGCHEGWAVAIKCLACSHADGQGSKHKRGAAGSQWIHLVQIISVYHNVSSSLMMNVYSHDILPLGCVWCRLLVRLRFIMTMILYTVAAKATKLGPRFGYGTKVCKFYLGMVGMLHSHSSQFCQNTSRPEF